MQKGVFLRIWISSLYLLPKQWVCRKDIDNFLFNLKITTHHDFIPDFNFQLVKGVFSQKMTPKELLRHKEVNYFFHAKHP